MIDGLMWRRAREDYLITVIFPSLELLCLTRMFRWWFSGGGNMIVGKTNNYLFLDSLLLRFEKTHHKYLH